MVRELGLKRRETVWSLSTVSVLRIESDSPPSTRGLAFVIIRYNRILWFSYQKQNGGYTYGGPVVKRLASPVSYV